MTGILGVKPSTLVSQPKLSRPNLKFLITIIINISTHCFISNSHTQLKFLPVCMFLNNRWIRYSKLNSILWFVDLQLISRMSVYICVRSLTTLLSCLGFTKDKKTGLQVDNFVKIISPFPFGNLQT